jgi:hypothetical protein
VEGFSRVDFWLSLLSIKALTVWESLALITNHARN